MLSLIIGGSASGKSEYAEQLVLSLPGNRVYVATMQPFDEECVERIAKHRRHRASRGFSTLEQYTNLATATFPPHANVLLECMSNLVANELYGEEGNGAHAVLEGVEATLTKVDHLTIVTNEVFSGGTNYDPETLHYLKELAKLNRYFAEKADLVVEVTAGLPNILKGELK